MDRDLVEQARGGDREAFAVLVHQVSDSLYAVAFRVLRDGKPLVKGWVNVGTEVVTARNVDQVYVREANAGAAMRWYTEHMGTNFQELHSLARPLPGK